MYYTLYRESEDGGVVSVFKQGALPYSAKKSVSSAKRMIVSKVGICTDRKKNNAVITKSRLRPFTKGSTYSLPSPNVTFSYHFIFLVRLVVVVVYI